MRLMFLKKVLDGMGCEYILYFYDQQNCLFPVTKHKTTHYLDYPPIGLPPWTNPQLDQIDKDDHKFGPPPIGGSPNGGRPNGDSPIGGSPSPIGFSPNGGSPIGGSPIGGSPNGGGPMMARQSDHLQRTKRI